ncbi:MAG: hypothetical protein JSR36_17610 [Proteobacteria bacterium]|nr:hypothetical protein [Pseudomonadota bacterium]
MRLRRHVRVQGLAKSEVFWGSLASTIGIFLPSFVLVLVAAPTRVSTLGATYSSSPTWATAR